MHAADGAAHVEKHGASHAAAVGFIKRRMGGVHPAVISITTTSMVLMLMNLMVDGVSGAHGHEGVTIEDGSAIGSHHTGTGAATPHHDAGLMFHHHHHTVVISAVCGVGFRTGGTAAL